MKSIQFFFKFFTVAAFLLLACPLALMGQEDDMPGEKYAGNAYCSDMIYRAKNIMEKKANQTCKSLKKTLPCTDRRTGLPVYVTLVVQPEKRGCPTIVEIIDKVSEGPASRGGPKDFTVEVLQEHCSRGGVTLMAYVPGNDNLEKKKIYDFEWMSGGITFDKDEVAECVTETKITLKVSKIETGQTVIRSITLDPAPAPSKDYKMFGYEKTACYGTCPVYKVAIHKSGKATWNGKSNVEKMGNWSATLSERQVKEIKERAVKAGYFDFHNKYPLEGQVADASRTITYVRFGDTEKKITHTLGGPDALVDFEEYLNKVISNLNWRKVAETVTKEVKE